MNRCQSCGVEVGGRPDPQEDRARTSPRPDVLRTPDERFGELPGYPWEPRYVDSLAGFEGLRLHYVDEGDAWVNANPDLAVGLLMRRACPHLGEAEASAYDAPFPSAEFKAWGWRFPNLVCDRPDADGAEVSRRAARWWRREWRGRSTTAWRQRPWHTSATASPPPASEASAGA
jgi:hypothetical protein